MPYRARGLWVQVKRGSKWVNLKKHLTARKAKKHAAALNINVRHK
jgi:hypothetical protein